MPRGRKPNLDLQGTQTQQYRPASQSLLHPDWPKIKQIPDSYWPAHDVPLQIDDHPDAFMFTGPHLCGDDCLVTVAPYTDSPKGATSSYIVNARHVFPRKGAQLRKADGKFIFAS